jgi:hypothetical protein
VNAPPADLPLQFAVVAGMFALTILIHLLGLTGLVGLGRLHLERCRTPWLQVDRLLVPTVLAFGLALIHATEVATYAALFQVMGATTTWEQALYYSVSSYSTAGVAGLTFRPEWRVVGAFESLNGILLIGWSTAFLFEVLHRILNTEDSHPFPAGAIAMVSPRPKRSGSGAPSGTNSSDTELMQ